MPSCRVLSLGLGTRSAAAVPAALPSHAFSERVHKRRLSALSVILEEDNDIKESDVETTDVGSGTSDTESCCSSVTSYTSGRRDSRDSNSSIEDCSDDRWESIGDRRRGRASSRRGSFTGTKLESIIGSPAHHAASDLGFFNDADADNDADVEATPTQLQFRRPPGLASPKKTPGSSRPVSGSRDEHEELGFCMPPPGLAAPPGLTAPNLAIPAKQNIGAPVFVGTTPPAAVPSSAPSVNGRNLLHEFAQAAALFALWQRALVPESLCQRRMMSADALGEVCLSTNAPQGGASAAALQLGSSIYYRVPVAAPR